MLYTIGMVLIVMFGIVVGVSIIGSAILFALDCFDYMKNTGRR